MKLEQSFEVQAPLQRVWEALIDVERVAPCLPGASVTGRNPDGSYNGEFKVKIGPTSAAYSGKLHMEDIDEAEHSAVMQAAGTDKRGQGGAKATIVSSVAEAAGGATTVNVNTDYHITGRLARFGRGGMIEEISNRLLGRVRQLPAGDAGRRRRRRAAGRRDQGRAGRAPEPAPDPAPAASAFAAARQRRRAERRQRRRLSAAAPPADPVAPPTPPTAGPAVESEPLDAVSLVRAVVVKKVKTNPAPFVAAAVGLVLALRVLRRRR